MSKTYLKGSAREIVFKEGGSLINVWIDLDFVKEAGLIKKTKSGKSGLAFTVAKRREEGEYGDTHYMYVKEMDGSSSGKSAKPAKARPASSSSKKEDDGDIGDLPF